MFGMGTGVSSHLWSPTSLTAGYHPRLGMCHGSNVWVSHRDSKKANHRGFRANRYSARRCEGFRGLPPAARASSLKPSSSPEPGRRDQVIDH